MPGTGAWASAPPIASTWCCRSPERAVLACRYDQKQQVRRAACARVDRIRPGVVVRRIVRVGHASDPIARLHIEPDAMTLPEHHAGRPDLHLHPDRRAG